jgi:hypothetical protein
LAIQEISGVFDVPRPDLAEPLARWTAVDEVDATGRELLLASGCLGACRGEIVGCRPRTKELRENW